MLVWWLTCVLWSSVWVVIKIGLLDLPPLSFAGWRLVIALLVLAPFVVARRSLFRRSKRDWLFIFGTGVLLLGVNYALVFWGARFISSGLTAVLQSLTPVFGVLLAGPIAHQRIQVAQLLAVGTGIVGLVIIFRNEMAVAGRGAFLGIAAVSAGAFFVALTYVVIKHRASGAPPLVLTTGHMLAGSVPLVVAGYLREGNPIHFPWTPTAIAALLYLAMAGSVAAFWLNYWLLERMPASKVLAMSVIEPLIAIFLGALILGELLSPSVFIGGVLILVSTALLLREKRGGS